jgi:hypothetical protein
LAKPDGDAARELNEPGAVLVRAFATKSWGKAMAIGQRRMGWGQYKPDPAWRPEAPFALGQRCRQAWQ